MRRLLTLAAFFLIITVVPVCAQRGGGHSASAGSHGGLSGGHSGFTGGHISGGFTGHTGFAGHSAVGSNSHYGSSMGSRQSFGRGVQFGHGRVGDRRFRNRFGYAYPYYPYYGYYAGLDPYWWWDTYPSDDANQRALASQMNEENLEEQQALREQDQDVYARSMPRSRQPQASASDQAANDPARILIFRDQHQREIQNYAIVDEMLWIFTAHRIEKLPLAVLDVPATIKANEDRGVDFRLPGVSEGQ